MGLESDVVLVWDLIELARHSPVVGFHEADRELPKSSYDDWSLGSQGFDHGVLDNVDYLGHFRWAQAS